MARVHHVLSARKDNPVAKAGEPYYWWKNKNGPKRFSATYPRYSQTCTGRKSDFWAAVEKLEDGIDEAACSDDLEAAVDEAKSDMEAIRDEYQGSLDNMPEGLQQGDTGQSIQGAVEEIEGFISELESLYFDDDGDLEDQRAEASEAAGSASLPF